MKISHELPLTLNKYAYEWNDYDYCLPIFLDKYPEYKQYFMQAKKDNRFIIMDNSLFEGYTHTQEDLLEKINLIQPNIFVVPDEWNDSHNTYKNAKYWFNTLKPQLPPTVNLMVVIQGKNLEEMMNLYLLCEDLGYKYFAFNHSSITYQNINHHPNKLINQMNGRQNLIDNMRYNNIIKLDHYIHLLGASLPQEFLYYKDPYFDFIKSVDTSSPIINGALGIRYNSHGLFTKPTEKIDEIMFTGLEKQMTDIFYNVNKFKEFVN